MPSCLYVCQSGLGDDFMFVNEYLGEHLNTYCTFSRQQWPANSSGMEFDLSEEVLDALCGVNVSISACEVKEIYLPLARFILLQREHWILKCKAAGRFFSKPWANVPFVLGLAGSVAVGKSTLARLMQYLISELSGSRVDLVTTDGFIFAKSKLEEQGLMSRKGFPETYNMRAFLDFLYQLKSGVKNLSIPVYSHVLYDIVPGELQTLVNPEFVILEGLNILQSRVKNHQTSPLFVSDFLDYSIFLHAEEENIRSWFIDRVLSFRDSTVGDDQSFFHFLSYKTEQEVSAFAENIWQNINAVNLHENILPFKTRADLILNKAADHTIETIQVRK
jgi:type I pantothenate kinase